ncbi:MAG: tol-pal system protein YbgF [Rhodobacteraceae bacterium]|nr:MAG: tol-pal system protein YbgF [Paracoccaceae bacterium]
MYKGLVKLGVVVMGLAVMSGSSLAQSRGETLADIRQELTFLYTEMQSLKRELSTTQGAGAPSGAGSAFQRTEALEQELRRITGVVENLQFRIDGIVKDGTNRIGDLEFRLVELEGGDVTSLGKTTTLGGGVKPAVAPILTPAKNSGVELAASEQGDFDAAIAAYKDGDFTGSVTKFDTFLQTYPGGPLTGDVHYWRAEALASQGDWSNAARGFLESFSGSPKATIAPKALLRLGVSLAQLDQTEDACLTLGEVEKRYPSAGEVSDARSEMSGLSCS